MVIRRLFKRKETKSCGFCNQPIATEAFLCKHCGTPQKKKLCVVCAEEIHAAARRCYKCQSYQSGGRHFFSVSNTTIAWFTAFFAVMSTLITAGANILDRESNTTFRAVGTKNGMIRIEAWNTGQKPGILLDYQLLFNQSEANVSPMPLPLLPKFDNGVPREQRIVITHDKPQQINLAAETTLKAPCRPTDQQCLDSSRDRLIGLSFTVGVTIEESGKWWKFWSRTSYSHPEEDKDVPGKMIEGFFAGVCCNAQ